MITGEEDYVATRELAEQAAADLLARTWIDEGDGCPLPVNPFHIADRLGLKVEFHVLEPDISGMLAKRPFADPVIYINSGDHPNRQRFSCAHEIGHADRRATGRPDDSWGYIDRRGPSASRGDDAEEIYANQFGAALLMPATVVKDLHHRIGVSAMAVEFSVSLDAMRYRLDNLGLR